MMLYIQGAGQANTTNQTDDVGVFCSPLSQEYLLASQHFNLTRQDLRALCERVVDCIFGGADETARMKKIYAEWDGWTK